MQLLQQIGTLEGSSGSAYVGIAGGMGQQKHRAHRLHHEAAFAGEVNGIPIDRLAPNGRLAGIKTP